VSFQVPGQWVRSQYTNTARNEFVTPPGMRPPAGPQSLTESQRRANTGDEKSSRSDAAFERDGTWRPVFQPPNGANRGSVPAVINPFSGLATPEFAAATRTNKLLPQKLESRFLMDASSKESPVIGRALQLKRKGGSFSMIHVLTKVVHSLFGRITVRILWTRKPTSKSVAGAGVHSINSPLSAFYPIPSPMSALGRRVAGWLIHSV
jgi:hypothetical protein